VEREARAHRRHGVLPHAPADVAARRGRRLLVGFVLDQRVVRRRQVRRAAHEGGEVRRHGVDHLAGGGAGGELVLGGEDGQVGVPAVGQGPGPGRIPGGGASGVGGAPCRVLLRPRGVRLGRPPAGGAERLAHVVGHEELRLERPGAGVLGELDLVGAQRSAMCGRLVLLARRAVADVRADGDEGGLLGLGLGRRDRRIHGVDVVAVGHGQDVPAVRLEALADILGEGEIGGAVDGDVVVVVEDDQLAEPLVAGERGGLAADALHHAAVAGQRVGVVVHDVRAVGRGEEALGERHADRVGEPLTQWAGGRLDAGRVAVLGVAGRAAAPLPERLEIVEAQVVSGEVQQGVQQHARVAGGEHEPVAVRPRRVGRVVAQMAGEEGVGHRRRAHRHAGVAGVGLLDAVDGQEADGLDTPLLERRVAHDCAHGGPFTRASGPTASALSEEHGESGGCGRSSNGRGSTQKYSSTNFMNRSHSSGVPGVTRK